MVKINSLFYIVAIILLIGSTSCGSSGGSGGSGMQTARVLVDDKYVKDNTLDFYVETGCQDEPIICLADNDGYQGIVNLYARISPYKDSTRCVHVSVIFNQVPHGNALAINIGQPKMNGCTVLPPL